MTCVERDTNPCTVDSWWLPPGSTCAIEQQPLLDEGAACDAGGGPGACTAGACDPVPFIAAGSGSTTWRATTTPPGGPTGLGTVGGCEYATIL
ncbi:MAG: hypothetical protein WCE62_02705 [Polyangiales bacterium]